VSRWGDGQRGSQKTLYLCPVFLALERKEVTATRPHTEVPWAEGELLKTKDGFPGTPVCTTQLPKASLGCQGTVWLWSQMPPPLPTASAWGQGLFFRPKTKLGMNAPWRANSQPASP
jgi:hypothetical protein